MFPWNFYILGVYTGCIRLPVKFYAVKCYFRIWFIRLWDVCVYSDQSFYATKVKISAVFFSPLLISKYYFIGIKSVASVPLNKSVLFYAVRK